MLTTSLFDALMDELRRPGAVFPGALSQGLSDTDIDAATAAVGLQLPQEARLWWQLHNGVPLLPGELPGRGHAGPSWWLLPLDVASSHASEMRDEVSLFADDFGDDEVWSDTWLPIAVDGARYLVCDCAGGASGPTAAVYSVWLQMDSYPRLPSIGSLVELWLSAIRKGHWVYDPDSGQWEDHTQHGNYPAGLP